MLFSETVGSNAMGDWWYWSYMMGQVTIVRNEWSISIAYGSGHSQIRI